MEGERGWFSDPSRLAGSCGGSLVLVAAADPRADGEGATILDEGVACVTLKRSVGE